MTTATGRAALELLDDRWDELLGLQPLPNPTLSSIWLRELARWGTGLPLVAIAEADGELLAGAALEVRHGRRVSPSVATWLGPAAAAALAAIAPWRRVVAAGERWLLACPPLRLAYAQKRAAYELRRAERQGSHLQVRVVSGPDEVACALVGLFRVHRDRWRDRPGETPRFATTHAHRIWNMRTITAMAARGGVRLAEVSEEKSSRLPCSSMYGLRLTGCHPGKCPSRRPPGSRTYDVRELALRRPPSRSIAAKMGEVLRALEAPPVPELYRERSTDQA